MQQLGTGKQRAAKASRVLIAGSGPLCYASWSVRESSPDLPTMNMESYNSIVNESFSEGLHAGIEAALELGGDWDAGLPPFGSPPGIYIRDDLAGVTFLPNRLDGVPWLFPWIRIRSAANGGDVGGKVTFTAGGMNQGIYTRPATAV